MSFREVCTVTPRADGRYDGSVPEIWTIGPKVHGGSLVAGSAAAGLRALRDQLGEQADRMFPMVASTDFQSAPAPGKVVYAVEIRKVGRQVCTADVTLLQDDQPAARTALTFGRFDERNLQYPDANTAVHRMPVEPPMDALYFDARSGTQGEGLGLVVHLSQGCELRFDTTSAAALRGEHGEPEFRLWVRPSEEDAADPEVAALFALMAGDISPPVVLNLGKTGWAPTVQLTTFLRKLPAPGWLRAASGTRVVGSRFFDEDHTILDSTGAIVVQSRQLAMVPR